MKFKSMDTVKDFEELKKGDLLLIKWSDRFFKYNPKAKKIAIYNIAEVRTYDHEVICQRKDNHYFNYNLYLKGESYALEIFKIIES